jgi:cytoskeletal protein CcmA (bactofilin family)
MFGRKNGMASTSNGHIDCLIGAKTRIVGDTDFEGGLRIDGQIKGNLRGGGDSMLVVSELAQLEGEVKSAQAIINGKVLGTLYVSERLELQAKARVSGDVHYQTLEMHPGAVVEGRLLHIQGQASPEPVINLDLEPSAPNKSRQAA